VRVAGDAGLPRLDRRDQLALEALRDALQFLVRGQQLLAVLQGLFAPPHRRGVLRAPGPRFTRRGGIGAQRGGQHRGRSLRVLPRVRRPADRPLTARKVRAKARPWPGRGTAVLRRPPHGGESCEARVLPTETRKDPP
jgi:hypothetical protein